ncbi:MAG: hypothetical protein GVY27_10940, partial [Deinococcus-Thermus bacterium]|nr:hypothetical protein [Deinococcota bacterium]
MARRGEPLTRARPEAAKPRRRSAEPTRFDGPAAPVLHFVEAFGSAAKDGERTALERAEALLHRFETDARQAGVPVPAIKPARYGLAALIDQKARADPRIRLSTWSVLARQRLFDGRDVSATRLREFLRTADESGPDYVDLARFLDGTVLARLEAARQGPRRRTGPRWTLLALGGLAALILALAAYAATIEYRYHARVLAEFEEEILPLALDRGHSGPETVRRLDRLDAAVGRVVRAAARAPFRRAVVLPVGDSEAAARAAYAE